MPARQYQTVGNAVMRLVLSLAAALALCLVGFAFLPPTEGHAQGVPAPQGAQPAVFKTEEIDALVAPIALYPDNLIAQMLMASTYPFEVVQAARWQMQNQNLTGDQLDAALNMQPWDPSVKALCQVPTVLQQMNEKLDWTQKLGDAVLAQQQDVMASVQRLRSRAQDNGQLMSTAQQTVSVQPAPAVGGSTQTIVIEQAQPDVVYVPSYNPATVYGAWPYPAYPPYPYYPAGYVFGSALAFGAGLAIGGAIWNNNIGWGGGDINFNSNRTGNINGGNRQNWGHNVDHRQGVNYRDQGSRDKFNRGGGNGAQARSDFRGQGQFGQGGGRGQLGQGGGQFGQGGRAGQLGQGAGAGQLGQGGRAGQLGQGGGQFGQGGRAGAGQLGQGG